MKISNLTLTTAFACSLLACGPDLDEEGAPPLAQIPDARGRADDWYRPAPGTTWQWQLQGDINDSYAVDLYDVDLFDVPAAQIAAMKASGRRVICYLSAGSSEDWREDFQLFTEADQGNPLGDWPGERWLDVRSENVRAVLARRLDLAAHKGCDGVEPDNVQGYGSDTGFALTRADLVAFNLWMATEAHARGLAIGLKNGAEQIGELIEAFDFVLNEECHEYNECAPYGAFVVSNKPAFNVEYASSEGAARRLASSVCPASAQLGFQTLILPLDLDDSFRVACD